MTEEGIVNKEILVKAAVLALAANAVASCCRTEELSVLVATLRYAVNDYNDLMMAVTKERYVELNNVGALLA